MPMLGSSKSTRCHSQIFIFITIIIIIIIIVAQDVVQSKHHYHRWTTISVVGSFPGRDTHCIEFADLLSSDYVLVRFLLTDKPLSIK